MKIKFLFFLIIISYFIFSFNLTKNKEEKIYENRHYVELNDSIAIKYIISYCNSHSLIKKDAVILVTINDNSYNKYIYINHTINNAYNISELPIFYTLINGYLVFLYLGEENSLKNLKLSKEEAYIIITQFGIKEKINYTLEHHDITRVRYCDDMINVTTGNYFFDYIPCDYDICIKNDEFILLKK